MDYKAELNSELTGWWQVNTSSSSYIVDLDEKRFFRLPGDDATSIGNDNSWVNFTDVVCRLGEPMLLTWDHNGVAQMRVTTPVVAIFSNQPQHDD